MSKVTVSDLILAADRLEHNAGEDDGRRETFHHRVAAWLRQEIEQRQAEAAARMVTKITGTKPAAIRNYLRNGR